MKEEEKNKSLNNEQLYGHGSQRGYAKSDRAGWLPAVSYCSVLLCSQLLIVKNSQSVSQLPAFRRRRDPRTAPRHQRVRTHCKREIVMTTSEVVNKRV
jgi:hypothetical protein